VYSDTKTFSVELKFPNHIKLTSKYKSEMTFQELFMIELKKMFSFVRDCKPLGQHGISVMCEQDWFVYVTKDMIQTKVCEHLIQHIKEQIDAIHPDHFLTSRLYVGTVLFKNMDFLRARLFSSFPKGVVQIPTYCVEMMQKVFQQYNSLIQLDYIDARMMSFSVCQK
jgi:hypothetical protein